MTAAEPGEHGIPTGMEGKRDGGEARNAGNASNPALGYPSPRAKPRLMLPENSQLPKSGWEKGRIPSLPSGIPGKGRRLRFSQKNRRSSRDLNASPFPNRLLQGKSQPGNGLGRAFPKPGPLGALFSHSYPRFIPVIPPCTRLFTLLSQIYPGFIPIFSLPGSFSQIYPSPTCRRLSHTYPTFIPVYSHLELFPLGTTWRRERLGILTSFLHLSSQNTRSKHSCM